MENSSIIEIFDKLPRIAIDFKNLKRTSNLKCISSLLLNKNVDINFIDAYGYTVLMMIGVDSFDRHEDDAEIMKFLISSGARINITNKVIIHTSYDHKNNLIACGFLSLVHQQ